MILIVGKTCSPLNVSLGSLLMHGDLCWSNGVKAAIQSVDDNWIFLQNSTLSNGVEDAWCVSDWFPEGVPIE